MTKKIISILIACIFTMSIYILPSASAITLGELRSGSETSTDKTKAPAEEAKVKPEEKTPKPELKEGKEDKKYINPRLVCLLSVILPGGGHFYMNNDAKGLSFCLATGAGYTITGLFMIKTMLADRGSVAYKNYLLLTGFFFFITLIIHFVGIIEAYSDADELNKKNLFNDGNLYPTDVIKE